MIISLILDPAHCAIFTVTAPNAIHHQRLLHVLESDQYQVQDRLHPSLVDLVNDEKERLQLLAPCWGSKFTAIMLKEHNEGYVL